MTALVDLLGSGVGDGEEPCTGGGEREGGGTLGFLLGTLTEKGEGEAECEGLGSVADGVREGALWLSSSGSAFTSGSRLSEGDGDGIQALISEMCLIIVKDIDEKNYLRYC